ncbi:MAG: hypothetical protein AB9836_06085 [Aminipila sp.]
MKNKIFKICKDIIKITEEEIAECRGIYKEQLTYNHPLKMATVKKQNDLGRYNRKVIHKVIELKTILENGPEVEIKDDMRDSINKTIKDYENNLKHETGKEIKLTDREKELVEYGYMQAGLDMAWCTHKSREEMKEQVETEGEIISNLAEKYDIMIHEVEDTLKIVKEDFGKDTFKEQVEFAEKEIFSQMDK